MGSVRISPLAALHQPADSGLSPELNTSHSAMKQSVIIDKRFQGPPQSGNGGYCAGLLARQLTGAVQVTLRKPPPLDKALTIERAGDNLHLMDDATLLAEAESTSLELELPPIPDLSEAERAAGHFAGFAGHPFPACFVCGHERAPGDGLRIFAGPAGDLVAAPWRPDPRLADADGRVADEFVWAALDCPGYFAAFNGRKLEPALLGRMSAELTHGIKAGDDHVVVAWRIEESERKLVVGSALVDAGGKVAAVARGIWIKVTKT